MSITTFASQLDEFLSAVITRCVSVDPEDRISVGVDLNTKVVIPGAQAIELFAVRGADVTATTLSVPVGAPPQEGVVDDVFIANYTRLVEDLDAWLSAHGLPITEANGGLQVITRPTRAGLWAAA